MLDSFCGRAWLERLSFERFALPADPPVFAPPVVDPAVVDPALLGPALLDSGVKGRNPSLDFAPSLDLARFAGVELARASRGDMAGA
jgi:hypothetical protein